MAKEKQRGSPERRTATRPQPSASADVAIREGEARDIAAVVALDAQVTGLPKPEFWQEFAEPRTRRAEPRHFLVAEPPGGGRLLGFIIGEVRAWEFGSPPCGWVFAISVDPRTRLTGIGSLLLAAIEDRFRADGVTLMRTMMARDNHLLMSFFRSQGMMAGPYIELEKALD